MDERTGRALGALSTLGGLLAVLTTVPSRWYGTPDTDAYVFDPTAFSPLWIESTLMPVLGLLAGALLVAGVAGLLVRDRPVAGRLRRWGGYAAVVGLALFELGLLVYVATRPGMVGSGRLAAAIGILVGLLVLMIGLVIALPALVGTGVGYVRTDRPTVGYALVGGPLVSAAAAVVFTVTGLGAAGSLSVVVPFATTFVVVGYELWTHPETLTAGTGDEPMTGDGSSTGNEKAGDERAGNERGRDL